MLLLDGEVEEVAIKLSRGINIRRIQLDVVHVHHHNFSISSPPHKKSPKSVLSQPLGFNVFVPILHSWICRFRAAAQINLLKSVTNSQNRVARTPGDGPGSQTLKLVEAGGIEPPSARDPSRGGLHA